MATKPVWIPEKEAAKILGYQPETLRKYVKWGRLSIAFSAINGRKYHYNQNDIQAVQTANSTFRERRS